MRLCAASRPVNIVPDSKIVSPGFQVWISSRVTASRSTRRTDSPGSQLMSGHCSTSGGVCRAGPSPVSVKWVCRVAAQLGIIATGNDAAWVG